MARPKKEAPVVESSDFQMFSEVDMNSKEKVGSYLPAWAYSQLIGDLEQDIVKDEAEIRSANISADRLMEKKRLVEKKKERLHEIIESRPKVDNDKVKDVTDGLGEKIADSMFTKTDMNKGLADAHEEARRMSEPCITLTNEEANFALGCNVVPTKDRRISRNQAAKIWKIGRRYLGEVSNVEMLRRG